MIIYLLMLLPIVQYILLALAWQGVLVTAWVAIALTHILMSVSYTHLDVYKRQILDWGTGELLEETTRQYREQMQRRSAGHWKPVDALVGVR